MQDKKSDTDIYRTDFWSLWEKASVGWSERIALKYIYILSSVKQIASPGWMHETSAQGWYTGKPQSDGMGVQDGEHM